MATTATKGIVDSDYSQHHDIKCHYEAHSPYMHLAVILTLKLSFAFWPVQLSNLNRTLSKADQEFNNNTH